MNLSRLAAVLALTACIPAWSQGVSVIDVDPTSATYGNFIAVIPTSINTLLPWPESIALRSDGTLALVSNTLEGTVVVIDTDPNSPTYHQVLGSIPVGSGPQGLAFQPPDERYAFVAIDQGDAVVVLDTQNLSAVGDPVQVGYQPFGVAFNPTGTRAYVTNMGSGTLSVIDATTNPPHEILSFPADYSPMELIYRAQVGDEGDKLYIANNGSGSVSVMDPASGVMQLIPVDRNPEGIAITSDRCRVYVTNEGSSTASEIDTDYTSTTINTVLYTYSVGNTPERVAINPRGQWVYVTNEFTCDTSVLNIDPASPNYRMVTSIAAGPTPEGIVVTPDGKRAYIANETVGPCFGPPP